MPVQIRRFLGGGLRFNQDKPPGFEGYKRKLEEADRRKKQQAPMWEKREESLRKRYGQWNPTRKLSRQQISDIRSFKEQAPQVKTKQIADIFNINPEAIRRILKSQWAPRDDEVERIQQRTERRKQRAKEEKLKRKELAQMDLVTKAVPAHADVADIKEVVKQRRRKQKKLVRGQGKSGHRNSGDSPAENMGFSVGDLID